MFAGLFCCNGLTGGVRLFWFAGLLAVFMRAAVLFGGLHNRLMNAVVMISELGQSFSRNPFTRGVRIMRQGGIFFEQLQRVAPQAAFRTV